MNYAPKYRKICSPCKLLKKNKPKLNIETIFASYAYSSPEKLKHAQAAWTINLTFRQAQRIWKNYQQNGLHKLLNPPPSTYIGKLTTTQISHLSRFLMDNQASTLTDIKSYLSGSLGVNYAIGGVFDLCKRLGIKRKTGRPVHAHQPAGAVEDYKKNLSH